MSNSNGRTANADTQASAISSDELFSRQPGDPTHMEQAMEMWTSCLLDRESGVWHEWSQEQLHRELSQLPPPGSSKHSGVRALLHGRRSAATSHTFNARANKKDKQKQLVEFNTAIRSFYDSWDKNSISSFVKAGLPEGSTGDMASLSDRMEVWTKVLPASEFLEHHTPLVVRNGAAKELYRWSIKSVRDELKRCGTKQSEKTLNGFETWLMLKEQGKAPNMEHLMTEINRVISSAYPSDITANASSVGASVSNSYATSRDWNEDEDDERASIHEATPAAIPYTPL